MQTMTYPLAAADRGEALTKVPGITPLSSIVEMAAGFIGTCLYLLRHRATRHGH